MLYLYSDITFVVFWALRGGGAGSWGVIISTTFRVYPTFNGVFHTLQVRVENSIQAGELAELHARHIFDWDSFKVGQYFFSESKPPFIHWSIATFFPYATLDEANAAMEPFIQGIRTLGFIPNTASKSGNVNDFLGLITFDIGGHDVILGSRLIPVDVYRNDTVGVGQSYTKLYDLGANR